MKVYLSNGSVVKTADSDFITAVGNLPFSELVHVIACSDIVNQEQVSNKLIVHLKSQFYITMETPFSALIITSKLKFVYIIDFRN